MGAARPAPVHRNAPGLLRWILKGARSADRTAQPARVCNGDLAARLHLRRYLGIPTVRRNALEMTRRQALPRYIRERHTTKAGPASMIQQPKPTMPNEIR